MSWDLLDAFDARVMPGVIDVQGLKVRFCLLLLAPTYERSPPGKRRAEPMRLPPMWSMQPEGSVPETPHLLQANVVMRGSAPELEERPPRGVGSRTYCGRGADPKWSVCYSTDW